MTGTRMKFLIARVAVLASLAALTAGCATVPPEESVKARASAYWQARMKGESDKAYALSTPSYRKLRTEAQFRAQFGNGASIQRADVDRIDCSAEKCTVRMKLGVQPALMTLRMGVIDTYLDEIWLLEDNQWWHYQEP